LIQKRQSTRRLQPSIIRLRNSNLHRRDVSRSVHTRTSIIMTVRLDHAEQVSAVVAVDRPPQRSDLREDVVFMRLEMITVFDGLPNSGVVLQGVAGDVRLDLLEELRRALGLCVFVHELDGYDVQDHAQLEQVEHGVVGEAVVDAAEAGGVLEGVGVFDVEEGIVVVVFFPIVEFGGASEPILQEVVAFLVLVQSDLQGGDEIAHAHVVLAVEA
jgi:hypothetical protein